MLLKLLDPKNLNIARKGLLLVSLPLLTGLLFTVLLLALLEQAEQETAREARAKEIQSDVAAIGQYLFDSASTMSTYAFTRQRVYRDRYRAIIQESDKTYKRLLLLVANQPEEVTIVHRLQFIQDKLFKLLDQLDDPGELRNTLDFMAILGLREQIQGLTGQFVADVDEFRKVQKRLDDAAPSDASTIRLRVKQFLLLAAVFSIFLTLLLVVFFSRNITRRIGTVMDNAVRLASNKPLNLRLTGRDEIASLDRIFHDMASTLEKMERRERAMIEKSVDVICSVDTSSKFAEVSPASLAVWGYEPEELVARRVVDIVVAEDMSKLVEAQQQLAQGRPAALSEVRIVRKDDAIVYTSWSLSWSPSDQVYFCVVHDITARKAAEELLQENEARIRLVIESMPVALLIAEPDGTVEATNMAAEQLFGYKNEEIAGEPLSLLFAPGNSKGKQIGALAEDLLGRLGELEAVCKDGRTIFTDVSVSRFEFRSRSRILLAALDATEKHEIERLKQEFVSMISHDLRTPLTSIQGSLALLVQGNYGELTAKAKSVVHRVDANLSRVMMLLDGLLDLEKMQAGKMHLRPEVIEMASVVSRAVNAVSYLAEKKGITLVVKDEPLEGLADGPKLVQVLANLLSNAIKFSPDHSRISVGWQSLPEEIEVWVEDQGRGISCAWQQAIFERFSQVTVEDHTQLGGKGLGLAICKAIVEAHGGRIGVVSEEGVGSKFWFRIPQPADG